jgi:1,2-diacylglycerol 3-beta-glucosyltransferase
MIALSLFVTAVAAWLIVPTIADAVNLVAAMRRRGARLPDAQREQPRFLVMVPAHNEAVMLPACLQALAGQDYESYRVLVVADNCTDMTARVAAAAGVQCFEREDALRRGKPHAIAWALERVDLDAFDCMVIVDADCSVASDFLSELSLAGAARGVGAQPFNDVLNPAKSSLTRMAAVLSAATHGYAFRLKARSGRNVPLSAGMCLGVDVIRKHGWRSFSIGEDWETYARLTIAGVPILSAFGARLAALEASNVQEGASQRRRWMLGKLWVLRTFAGAIVRSNRISAGQKLDCLAELAQPGPALQLASVGVVAALLVVLQPPGWQWLLALAAATLLRTIAYTSLAIAGSDKRLATLSAFAYLPVYASWRLLSALRDLVGGRPGEWVRTGRSSSGP